MQNSQQSTVEDASKPPLQADLPLCPVKDCSANKEGHCIALTEAPPQRCPFYRDATGSQRAIKKCFYRLIRQKRFDLIRKYAKTLFRLGLFNREVSIVDEQRKGLELFGQESLESVRKGATAPGGLPPSSAFCGEENINDDADSLYFDNSIDSAVFPDGITGREIVAEVIAETAEAVSEIQAIADDNPDVQDITINNDVVSASTFPIPTIGDKIIHALISGTIEMKGRSLIIHDCLPGKGEKRIDPVIAAYTYLAANIVYAAVEDYIETLRRLWRTAPGEARRRDLIIDKWELETFFGSYWYWQLVGISPEKILDRCWVTAEELETAAIERRNKRNAAGLI